MKKLIKNTKELFKKVLSKLKPSKRKAPKKISFDLTFLKTISFFEIAKIWMPMAVLITLFSFTLYFVEQRQIRMSADVELVQIAEDTAELILFGSQPPEGLAPDHTDLLTSKAPFMVVFDESGKAIYASGGINNTIPELPQSVFEKVRKNGGSTRFTWVPVENLHLAAVIQQYNGDSKGFVLAGKSLKEFDRIILAVSYNIGIGAAISLLVTFILSTFIKATEKKPVK